MINLCSRTSHCRITRRAAIRSWCCRHTSSSCCRTTFIITTTITTSCRSSCRRRRTATQWGASNRLRRSRRWSGKRARKRNHRPHRRLELAARQRKHEILAAPERIARAVAVVAVERVGDVVCDAVRAGAVLEEEQRRPGGAVGAVGLLRDAEASRQGAQRRGGHADVEGDGRGFSLNAVLAFVVRVEVEIAAVGTARGDAEAEAKAQGQDGESLGDGTHREVAPEKLTRDFKRSVKGELNWVLQACGNGRGTEQQRNERIMMAKLSKD